MYISFSLKRPLKFSNQIKTIIVLGKENNLSGKIIECTQAKGRAGICISLIQKAFTQPTHHTSSVWLLFVSIQECECDALEFVRIFFASYLK